MSANAVVRARIDEHIKEEAEAVLASMGLTVSGAIRMMLIRIATEKALPFDPLLPNAETIDAMRAARRREIVSVGSSDSLLSSLNADD
jgi:DNA-damage-inducible protein J